MPTTSLSLFDLRPGKLLLGRYQILKPHREGGISSTFAVEDEEHEDRRLELQAFTGGMFEDRKQASEFAERLMLWKALDVASVLKVHDVQALDDGSVLLVTDFPSGMSLRGWMKENTRMEAHEVVSLSRELLSGLVEVHDNDLVHGDIKPASIFFHPGGGKGALVDSGITPAMWAAKHLGTRTALIGTPYYAPMEQFTGDSPDELSDLYNLSTVMYELLTGVLPWSGKGYIEVFQSKMQKAPPKMAIRAPSIEVNPVLEAVISTGLRAVRSERHPSATAFLDRLQAVDLDS